MSTTLPFFWNRCVDFYREICRMPDLLNATVSSGGTTIEFTECRDCLKTLYDELPSLIPYTTRTRQLHLQKLILEAADRYNAYLELLRQGVARERELVEINTFHKEQLAGWVEANLLEYVAALVAPAGDEGADIIESTQQLFELKPNIAGIGLNLNALITWVRSRISAPDERRTRR